MNMLSQAKAAKLAGVSRGTIANRIEDGKLSRSPDGIDVAELVRVFPQITTDRIEQFLAGEADSTGVSSSELSGQGTGTLSDTAELLEARLNAVDADKQWLRELLDRRERQLEEKDRQLAEAQARLDEREKFWTSQVNQLQALLPAPAAAPRKKFLGLF